MYETDDYEIYDPYAPEDDAELPASAYYYVRWPEEDEEDEPTWTLWRVFLLVVAILIVLSFIGYELLPLIQTSVNPPPPPPSTPIPRV